MNVKEIVKVLNEIENSYPVEEWQINKIRVWPIIRKMLAARWSDVEVYHPRKQSLLKRYGNKIIRLYHLFLLAFKFKRNTLPLCDVDALVFHDNTDRNILLKNGSWYDHNLDPIVDALNDANITCMSLERIVLEKKIKAPFYDNSYVINMELFLHRLKYYWKNRETYSENLNSFDDFSKQLINKYNTVLCKKDVVHYANCVKIYANYFKTILIEKKVKVVFLQNWYSLIEHALSLACSEVSISAVDVQHGVAGAGYHDSYNGWKKFPTNKSYELLPSYFLCWTWEDKYSIDSWATNYVKAFCVGKPIEYSMKKIEQLTDAYYLKYFTQSKKVILFSLSWGNDVPEWIINFIKNNNKEYIWLIRYHPHIDIYQRKFTNALNDNENIIIEGVENIPLEMLLPRCYCHITMYSSVVIEANFYGKMSIVVHKDSEYMYGDLIKKGRVLKAYSPEELSISLLKIQNKKIDVSSKDDLKQVILDIMDKRES